MRSWRVVIRPRSVAALAALLIACASHAKEGTGGAEVALGNPDTSLAEFDQSLERLKRDIWNVQRLTPMFGRDFRGRTLSDDLRDFALVPKTQLRLRTERALFTQKKRAENPQTLQIAVAELLRTVAEENSRLDEIFAHRLRHRRLARQRDLWRDVAALDANYQTPENITNLEQRAVVTLNAGNFAATMDVVYPALLRAYATERESLLTRRRPNLATLAYYPRRTPCGVPANTTSGNASPALATKTTPYYPSASRRAGEEGRVFVRILISASGCVTDAAIAITSGWPDLDDAALDWLETANFAPAERDGKPIASTVTMPLSFKLD